MRDQYFLFDWDGCLANTLPLWVDAFHNALGHFDITAPDHQVKSGLHDWRVFSSLGIANLEHFAEHVYAHIVHQLHQVELNDGASQLLNLCKDWGSKVAIVTSSQKRKVLPVLEQNGLQNLFDVIVAQDDVKHLKPNPEPLHTALDALGGTPSQAWMIGDASVDIDAGKAAGTGTIWYNPESNRSFHPTLNEEALAPDISVEHLGQIANVV